MSVFFSRQCEYALQAIMVLATKSGDGWTSVSEITERIDGPISYLAKILQDLSRKGILESQKGLHGGFKLARSSDRITLLEIVEVIDGTEFLKRCVLGFPDCSTEKACPVHETWGPLRELFKRLLLENSVADLVAKTPRKFTSLA